MKVASFGQFGGCYIKFITNGRGNRREKLFIIKIITNF
jgi:hypothetical protein